MMDFGPASVSTTMKYQAPNPSDRGGSLLTTLLLAGGAAWLLLTPSGRSDVTKVQQYIDQKFNLGGASTSG